MAERHDILSLDRRDERLRQFIRKFMPLLVCRALDLMNLVQPVRDLFRSEIRQDILQKMGCPATALRTRGKVIKIISILFFRHLGFLLLSKYEHKNLRHYKADESASRKCKDPGKHHILYNAEIDG